MILLPLYVNNVCICVCFKFNAFLYIMFMGIRLPGFIDVVAFSSLSKSWDMTSSLINVVEA